jgi:hypothetical protein
MRFEDFGCERRMSRDKIGVASWCSGMGGPEDVTPYNVTGAKKRPSLTKSHDRFIWIS